MSVVFVCSQPVYVFQLEHLVLILLLLKVIIGAYVLIAIVLLFWGCFCSSFVFVHFIFCCSLFLCIF